MTGTVGQLTRYTRPTLKALALALYAFATTVAIIRTRIRVTIRGLVPPNFALTFTLDAFSMTRTELGTRWSVTALARPSNITLTLACDAFPVARALLGACCQLTRITRISSVAFAPTFHAISVEVAVAVWARVDGAIERSPTTAANARTSLGIEFEVTVSRTFVRARVSRTIIASVTGLAGAFALNTRSVARAVVGTRV